MCSEEADVCESCNLCEFESSRKHCVLPGCNRCHADIKLCGQCWKCMPHCECEYDDSEISRSIIIDRTEDYVNGKRGLTVAHLVELINKYVTKKK